MSVHQCLLTKYQLAVVTSRIPVCAGGGWKKAVEILPPCKWSHTPDPFLFLSVNCFQYLTKNYKAGRVSLVSMHSPRLVSFPNHIFHAHWKSSLGLRLHSGLPIMCNLNIRSFHSCQVAQYYSADLMCYF